MLFTYCQGLLEQVYFNKAFIGMLTKMVLEQATSYIFQK